jgi:hypothetical protein
MQKDIWDSIWRVSRKYIVISLLVIIILIILFQIAFKLQPGESFSLGQLIIDAILLPIAITGFIFALTEFRVNQQIPKLNLYLEEQNGIFVKSIIVSKPSGGDVVSEYRLKLVLKNEGGVVTTWYLVQFEIPEIFCSKNKTVVEPLIGGKFYPTQVDSADAHWRLDPDKESNKSSFMSNGKFALYPNYPQPLCNINISLSPEKPSDCNIPYVIYSDKGKEENGKLEIHFLNKN